MVAMVAGVIAR